MSTHLTDPGRWSPGGHEAGPARPLTGAPDRLVQGPADRGTVPLRDLITDWTTSRSSVT